MTTVARSTDFFDDCDFDVGSVEALAAVSAQIADAVVNTTDED